jgi:ceramide glucosyltransferase
VYEEVRTGLAADHLMAHYIFEFLRIISFTGTIASICYCCLCVWSAAAFRREQKKSFQSARPRQFLPPVSILKPLKGTDREMYETLRSHGHQEYPEYEIIFGVSEADDPAVELVKKLRQEFPQRAIQVMVCEQKLGANIKVSNLVQMAREARYDTFVVSDSDICVPPDYLQQVVAPLSQADVGLVTCLYRGAAAGTFGSRLESLGISTDFIPGVLAARTIERGIRFGLGSTLAFRRQDLQAIGGFESFADYLADDYELGRRIAALGREIKLSTVIVETFLPDYTLREFFRHQLRWARTIRDARRLGYLGLVLTFGLPWALLTLALAQGATWAAMLFPAAVGARLAMALVFSRIVLQDTQAYTLLWLVPLHDFISPLVWAFSLAGNTVAWRSDPFRLKDGKLVRLNS